MDEKIDGTDLEEAPVAEGETPDTENSELAEDNFIAPDT